MMPEWMEVANLTHVLEDKGGSTKNILTFLFISCLCLMVFKICYKIFKKYRFNLEPVHIFLVNFFFCILLSLITNMINSAHMLLFPLSEMCLNYSSYLLVSVYLSLSIIAMQIDRYLAIKLEIHYKNKINNTRSIIVICICIGFAIVTATISLFSFDFNICAEDWRIMETRTLGIVLGEIPKILAVVMTISVLYYSVKT